MIKISEILPVSWILSKYLYNVQALVSTSETDLLIKLMRLKKKLFQKISVFCLFTTTQDKWRR